MRIRHISDIDYGQLDFWEAILLICNDRLDGLAARVVGFSIKRWARDEIGKNRGQSSCTVTLHVLIPQDLIPASLFRQKFVSLIGPGDLFNVCPFIRIIMYAFIVWLGTNY